MIYFIIGITLIALIGIAIFLQQQANSTRKQKKPPVEERVYGNKTEEEIARCETEALDLLLQKRQDSLQTPDAIDETPEGFANGARLEHLMIPKDNQGFLVTFSPDQEEEYFQFFKQFGIVAIQVLSDDECEKSQEEVWNFLERCHPLLKKDDPSTWETTWPVYSHVSVSGDTPVLSPQMFLNRQNSIIHRIFSVLYGTPKLWVSVDRANIARPTRKVPYKVGPSEWKLVDKEEWRSVGHESLHWETNPWSGKALLSGYIPRDLSANRGFERWKLLGFLALQDCGSDDGVYYGVPGFHHYFKTWAQSNRHIASATELGTAVPFQVPQDDPIRKECQKFPLRRGCLLILHPAIPYGSCPNDSPRGRMIQYLRMIPQDDTSISPYMRREWLPQGFSITDLGEKLLGLKSWD